MVCGGSQNGPSRCERYCPWPFAGLTVQNQIGAFLADHAGGHVGVDDERHDRGVRHTQALHAVNAQARIHHGKPVAAHLAGADGMIDGLRLGRAAQRAAGCGRV